MLTLETTAQFRRDYRRVKKRGYKMALLAEVLDALLAEEPLLPKHRDHALTGPMKDYRECHILPDCCLSFLHAAQGHQYRHFQILLSKKNPEHTAH